MIEIVPSTGERRRSLQGITGRDYIKRRRKPYGRLQFSSEECIGSFVVLKSATMINSGSENYINSVVSMLNHFDTLEKNGSLHFSGLHGNRYSTIHFNIHQLSQQTTSCSSQYHRMCSHLSS